MLEAFRITCGPSIYIPCDAEVVTGAQSPPRWPLERGPFKIGNRIAVQPMEGWDELRMGRHRRIQFGGGSARP